MNTADGMSDEELDVWADIFYQGKTGGILDIPFSHFLKNPFEHLDGGTKQSEYRERKTRPHLMPVS